MRFALSLLIPARNEQWLPNTIADAIEHSSDETEVIAVLDGYWPAPPIPAHPRLTLIHLTEPIGQRAAVNLAARTSRAKYVAKFDAHCSFAAGFDQDLMAPYESGEISVDTTTVPRMYNLHVFDWACAGCGERTYQGGTPPPCVKCGAVEHRQEMAWKPRLNKLTDFGRFDRELHFQYWNQFRLRPEAKGDIADLMCCVGAGWAMTRDRYWQLGGLDEGHGSWGQMGVEIACKSWLSGGRQVVNKRTWFAHLFRVQSGFSFPYSLSQHDVEAARVYSGVMWANGNWSGQSLWLEWLIDKFSPVPGW